MSTYIPLTSFPAFKTTDSFIAVIAETPGVTDPNIPHKIADHYLVEPRRTSTNIIRFTGTLGQGPRIDKLGNSVLAFAHWAASHTAGKLVFADLQGELTAYT